MIKKILKRIIPHPVLSAAKRTLVYSHLDLWDWVRGRREPLVPPRRKIFIGGPEYRRIGDWFFNYFRKECRITPQSQILDIGCGIGRMSRPLVDFLSAHTHTHTHTHRWQLRRF